jgi:hypothetical protein
MTKLLVTIVDLAADMIIGGIHLFAHEAAAVRFFGDLQTMIARHPKDHVLRLVGTIDETTGAITPDSRDIITGAALAEVQRQTQENAQ